MKHKKTYNAPIVLDPESDQGDFEAAFATLGVLDHDGDITESGAFHDGQEVLIEAWNHGYGNLPVGKGVIREDGNQAIINGAFFMQTQAGLEHYKTIKAMGPLAEWSYTFSILGDRWETVDGERVHYLSDLDVWGVAPVQRGAGIETRTIDIKSKNEETQTDENETVDSLDDQDQTIDGEDVTDVKPSGVGPGVILAQIELIELEIQNYE